MKKFILVIILSLVSFALSARKPNLNVEKIFDGSYNTKPGVSINISRTQEKYFRGCSVTDNGKLVKKIESLFAKDLPKSSRSQDITSNGSRFCSMVIENNGQEIYVGLSYEPDNGCYLFISGPLKAFK